MRAFSAGGLSDQHSIARGLVNDRQIEAIPVAQILRDNALGHATLWADCGLNIFWENLGCSSAACRCLQRVDFYLLHKAQANDLNTGSLLAPIKVDVL